MRHLSYTNVMATLALFLALGGTSYAAAQLTSGNVRNGTVTGADLRSESVKGRDVDSGSIGGADLRNASLTSSDLGSLAGSDLAAGQLPAGPPGPAGTTRVLTRRVNDMLLQPGDNEALIASCAPGEVAVGGGGFHDATLADPVVIAYAHPLKADGSPPGNGERATQWLVAARNHPQFGVPSTVTAYVLCANL